MESRYVLIAGQGRSGTNWLLDLLDFSPRTHCRSEPNALEGSALSRLPCGWPMGTDLEATWDEAIRRTSRSLGERDRRPRVRKDHLSGLSQRLGLADLLQSARCRRALGLLRPSLRRAEWDVPRWLASEDSLATALPVIKLNQVPGWMNWALKNRPRAHVLHIVRHPGGFLNSYSNRWLARQPSDRVVADNRRRLEMVVASAPAWAARFGDIASMSLSEAELWFWRYAAEVIHEAGRANPEYQLIIYEDLVRDPIGVARSIFEGCGLPWDAAVERSIGESAQESGSISVAWRQKLSPEQIELTERILDGSPIEGWWTDAGAESRPQGAIAR